MHVKARSMEPVWVKSKWDAKQLNGRTARFRLRQKKETGGTVPVEGKGKIDALDGIDGLIRVDVVVEHYPTPHTGNVIQFHLPQEAEPWIRKCADGTADFEIIDPSI